MNYNWKIHERSYLSHYSKYNYEVGFTSGCFDILHAGHIDFLRRAKRICDVLIVGVNSDFSVTKLKGPDRPIIYEQDRINIIASLQYVDFAFIFDEINNNENIKIIQPKYYIKSGYTEEDLTSRKFLMPNGELRILPINLPRSTSEIIKKIKSLN